MRLSAAVLLLSLPLIGTAAPAPPAALPALDAAAFARHVEILASDAFEGRAPGTAGEQRTIEYLVAQFAAAGLEPAFEGSWLQAVPAVESLTDPASTLTIDHGDGREALQFGEQMVLAADSGVAELDLDGSPLLFVGYGIDAPERGWNDYRDLDLQGRTVVVLVNDPGYASGDPALFDGRTMTYHGRWTYKFEQAAQAGARGALLVHDAGAAGYGWEVVRAGWLGRAQFELPAAYDPAPRLALRGWLHADAARALFARSGHDLDALRQAAGRPGFRPLALDARVSARIRASIRHTTSHNVVGRLAGRTQPDEAVLYLAHWDHFGRNNNLEGDQIINGAIDNATGLAALLEIARGFNGRAERPRRSVLFAAVTLEESGLLGSRYLAAAPPLPPAQMVAALTFDALDPRLPRNRRMQLVGRGSSELDDRLEAILAVDGWQLVDEPEPEKGLRFRSDHFSFAKIGVPALVAGLGWSDEYTAQHYHRPSDEYDPDWDFSGVLHEVGALFRLGVDLAEGSDWPQWRADQPYRAVREASRSGR
jgi:Zn-dependent M28 family amino/carboxypeptidase